MKPTLYLAGAIRDGRQEDVSWRERLIDVVGQRARILSPLAGKSYSESTQEWRIHREFVPSADFIVRHDFWMVRQADIVVANLQPLAEKYPSIGTLVELGYAFALGKLVYLLLESGYTGHENQTMYSVHPFLQQNAAIVFQELAQLERFLLGHLGVLSGAKPSFLGVMA